MSLIRSYTFWLAAVLAVSLAGGWLTLSQYAEKNEQLTKANEGLRAELKTLQQSFKINQEAYGELSKSKTLVKTKTRTVIKRIKARPAKDNAPIAPVLKSALEAIE